MFFRQAGKHACFASCKNGDFMRRKDRECSSAEFADLVFQKAGVITLAMFDGDYPYCLPLNFARKDTHIYIHTAREGKKLLCLQANPHVAFSLFIDEEVDQKNFTTYYKSLCGTGIASIVTDAREKCAALDAIGEKYQALCPRPCLPENAARVTIARIEIKELSGKKNEKKQSG